VYRTVLMHMQAASSQESTNHYLDDRISTSGDVVFRIIQDVRDGASLDVLLIFNIPAASCRVVSNSFPRTCADYCFIDGYRRRIEPHQQLWYGKTVAVFASQTSEGHFHGKDEDAYAADTYIRQLLRPWSLQDATAALQPRFTASDIERAYVISDGSLRNLTGLLQSSRDPSAVWTLDDLRARNDVVWEAIAFTCDMLQVSLPRKALSKFDAALRKSDKTATIDDPNDASLLVHQDVSPAPLSLTLPTFASVFARTLLTKWSWSSGVDKIERFIKNFGTSSLGRLSCSLIALSYHCRAVLCGHAVSILKVAWRTSKPAFSFYRKLLIVLLLCCFSRTWGHCSRRLHG